MIPCVTKTVCTFREQALSVFQSLPAVVSVVKIKATEVMYVDFMSIIVCFGVL